ncbi:MAG: ribosome maturation factor RimM [Desulfovibrionaceae bacterium]|jgi:16S rRNA processing protein RimM
MAATQYIHVGDVVRPHGIRGELGIDCYADSPSAFAPGSRLRLAPPDRPERGCDYAVRAVREHKGRLLVTLEGVPDRTAAETLRGLAVWARAEDLPEPEEDEVFLHELPGLRVRLAGAAATDPDLGVIEDVLDAGGAELWRIRDAAGREILFPAVDELVPEIDLDAGYVVIDPPPGLLELYQRDEPET